MKWCLRCGLINPESAKQCECKYDFETKAECPSLPSPPPFFPVSTQKFIVLAICTFTIYERYWCYQNWKRVKSATGENLSPFWRAVFAPFWGFKLFRRVYDRAVSDKIAVGWHPVILGILYLVWPLAKVLPDPWWMIWIASFLPAVPVVQTANRVNQQGLTADPNATYSGANVVEILLGGLVLALLFVGALAPK